MHRFAIEQGMTKLMEPKFRAIDDGAASLTNAMAATEIRVHTTSVDAVVSLSRHLYEVGRRRCQRGDPPIALHGGVEDEASAFRCVPTSDADANVLIVAALHPDQGCMLYHEILGHPFGLGASVKL